MSTNVTYDCINVVKIGYSSFILSMYVRYQLANLGTYSYIMALKKAFIQLINKYIFVCHLREPDENLHDL